MKQCSGDARRKSVGTPLDALGGRWRMLVAATVVSALLVAAVAVAVDISALARLWSAMDGRWALAATGWAAVALLARSRRIYQLLSGEHARSMTVVPSIRVASLHQVLFMSLPSGLGDAAFPFLVRSHLHQSVSMAIGCLLVMRTQDLVMIATLGAAAACLLWVHTGSPAMLALTVGVAGFLATFYVPRALGAAATGAMRLVTSCADRDGGTLQSRWRDRLLVASGYLRTRTSSPSAWKCAFWTLASWIATGACVDACFRAFGVSLLLGQIGAMLFGLNVIGAAAILTIAGVGAVEAGLAGMIVLLAVETPQAVELAVVVRSLLLATNIGVPAAFQVCCGLFGIKADATRPTA